MKKGSDLASPYIQALPPYSLPSLWNEMEEKYGIKEPVRLDCNENPCGPSPKAVEAIIKAAQGSHFYPESSNIRLRRKLAALNGLQPEMITLGNGGDHLLTCLAETFCIPGDEVIIGHPSFSSYYTAFRATGAALIKVPLKEHYYDIPAILAAITPQTKLIIICNPNNPTSTMLGEEEIAAFMAQVPADIIVLFDEAYGQFAPEGYPDCLPYLGEDKNVLILRTFSKFYGLAGLRAGYLMGAGHLIDMIRKYQEAFSLNVLAQAAAEAALDDVEYARISLATVVNGRAYLTQALTDLGCRVLPSAANFVFAECSQDTGALTDKLMEKGYLIRPLPKSAYLRISIGTEEQNRGLIQAMREIMGSL